MNKPKKQSSFHVLSVVTLFLILCSISQCFGADCNWNSGDPHKMHWAQEPDLSSTGVDISMYIATVADDFKCSSSGTIDDIHLWGSFINDTLPDDGPDSLTFRLSIYSDIPAQGDIMSKPGDSLWTKVFKPGEYTATKVYDGLENWYDPPRSRYYPDNNRQVYQYDFCIDSNPFNQEEGTVYWLVVDELGPDFPDYKFGWKSTTRDLHWNDNSSYLIDGQFAWKEITYPDEHDYKGEQLDLAFVITGKDQIKYQYDWGDAPDWASAVGYPTLSFNNGANHIIDGPWLGYDSDYPDAELNGQPELSALGDDLDIEPLFSLGPPNDDENGVSIPPMFRGFPADITLEVNGGGGYVDAWIDFNRDMAWQPSERICWWFLPDGTNTITFIVPADAVIGETFARFRISKEGSLSPVGPAKSGEVEDYLVNIHYNCARCLGQEFVRGDTNQDTVVDDEDVTAITEYILTGAPKPKCMDAADADDNGVVDINDATYIINYLNGGPQPPEPFPNCDLDPTADMLSCGEYDYCQGCLDVNYVTSKWFQLPDVTANGIDIRIDSNDGNIRTIADDFECRNKSLLTDVHLWCSWKADIRGVIENIHLSIHSDDPAGTAGSDKENKFSKPEPGILWKMDFPKGKFHETLYHTLPEPGEWWWDPVKEELTEGGDRKIWRIDIKIDPNVAFVQQGTPNDPRIYWLKVQVDANNGEIGWKTRRWPDHYMDDAVWDVGSELPRIWKELRYPKTHPYYGLEKDIDSIDMAFCLTYTHDSSMPTSMPASETSCPVVATQCPTVLTRCPSEKTKCPVIATRCPEIETQCAAITMCPPVKTTCPAANTLCPVVDTECPATDTECPVEQTFCPVYETRCPVVETQCPPQDTQCPLITMCPPTETTCPALRTRCPVIETQCPVADTKCPIDDTRCPVVETRCPPKETYCPEDPTRCPIDPTRQCYIETMFPPVDTECPPIDTSCPIEQTVCPVFETRCPAQETECPFSNTKCPIDDTQCPVVETYCPPEITYCPEDPTKCPVDPTGQCYIQTMFPPIDTECPAVETECPVVPTTCPLVPVFTQCPATTTICTPGCQITSLPDFCEITFAPGTPGCIILNGTKSPPIISECPAIETECPTIIPSDLLSKLM
ncbi:MAG: hypothetical protein JW715_11925 [Sedimentisphaerales bacterium]|nr:hypothetical protein [Sedimentisphaerales bacterium]